MKKILLLATAFLFEPRFNHAKSPDSWTVNPSAYNNSMTVTAVLIWILKNLEIQTM
jgi:hypothetical protein